MKVTKAHTATLTFGHGRHKYNVLIDIPAGLKVTSQTACGYDENYNFLNDFSFLPEDLQYLKHDLVYRGYNVPTEHLQTIEA